MSCNGWNSSETWIISMWYDTLITSAIEEGIVSDSIEMKDYIVDIIHEAYPETTSGLLADLINWNHIDWNELFENFSSRD